MFMGTMKKSSPQVGISINQLKDEHLQVLKNGRRVGGPHSSNAIKDWNLIVYSSTYLGLQEASSNRKFRDTLIHTKFHNFLR